MLYVTLRYTYVTVLTLLLSFVPGTLLLGGPPSTPKGEESSGLSATSKGATSKGATSKSATSKSVPPSGAAKEKAPADSTQPASRGATGKAKSSPDAGTPAKAAKPSAEEKEPYSVIQIGEREIKVVPTKEVETIKKRFDEQYKQKVEEHKAAKEAAYKGKTTFSEPKPERKTVKILASGLTGKKEIEVAREAALEKLQAEKAAQKKAAKAPSKGAKPAKPAKS